MTKVYFMVNTVSEHPRNWTFARLYPLINHTFFSSALQAFKTSKVSIFYSVLYLSGLANFSLSISSPLSFCNLLSDLFIGHVFECSSPLHFTTDFFAIGIVYHGYNNPLTIFAFMLPAFCNAIAPLLVFHQCFCFSQTYLSSTSHSPDS